MGAITIGIELARIKEKLYCGTCQTQKLFTWDEPSHNWFCLTCGFDIVRVRRPNREPLR